MKSLISRFVSATAFEHCLVAAGIAVAIVTALQTIGTALNVA
jgi:Flp pilus assembly pilin Flp